MSTGITKRHSKRCPARDGRRCTCKARYEAWVSPVGTGRSLCSAGLRRSRSPPSTVDNRAQEFWEAAGLDGITLHEARHTFASLLIDSGANAKAVQEFVGHSKIQTTFDVHGHLLPGSHDQVRERMDAYLAGPEEVVDLEAEDAP